LIRYGVVGLAIAALYATIYCAVVAGLKLSAQLANATGFSVALVVGYLLHSRWSFRGEGGVGNSSWSRFVIVNVLAYGLNCFWVWLLVDRLGGRGEAAILPIVFLTPACTYMLNRWWTFA
jgi:putative flippase GtrA